MNNIDEDDATDFEFQIHILTFRLIIWIYVSIERDPAHGCCVKIRERRDGERKRWKNIQKLPDIQFETSNLAYVSMYTFRWENIRWWVQFQLWLEEHIYMDNQLWKSFHFALISHNRVHFSNGDPSFSIIFNTISSFLIRRNNRGVVQKLGIATIFLFPWSHTLRDVIYEWTPKTTCSYRI
jgi:hypothetical protein